MRNEISANNSIFAFDAESYTKNGRTLVPLRLIAESLGADVNTHYDPDLGIAEKLELRSISIDKRKLNEKGLYFNPENEEELDAVARQIYANMSGPNGEYSLPGNGGTFKLSGTMPYERFKNLVRATNNVQMKAIEDSSYGNGLFPFYIEEPNFAALFPRPEISIFLANLQKTGFAEWFYRLAGFG